MAGLAVSATPLKHALLSQLSVFKSDCATELRVRAKAQLVETTDFIESMEAKVSTMSMHVLTPMQLGEPVDTLEDLVRVMQVLHEVESFAVVSDTTPIENMYEMLERMHVNLPREEVSQVQSLHDDCQHLNDTASEVKAHLTGPERSKFERLLDTHAKSLMVATIHLRNSFEDNGPMSENISATEALHRLRRLSALYKDLQLQREVRPDWPPCLTVPHLRY